jgi:hypothetical protein
MQVRSEKAMSWEAIMKPLPTHNAPGKTPWERFDNAFRKIITVPKEAFVKEEVRLKKLREKKRAKKS